MGSLRRRCNGLEPALFFLPRLLLLRWRLLLRRRRGTFGQRLTRMLGGFCRNLPRLFFCLGTSWDGNRGRRRGWDWLSTFALTLRDFALLAGSCCDRCCCHRGLGPASAPGRWWRRWWRRCKRFQELQSLGL